MTSIAESLKKVASALAASGVAESGREAVSLMMLATRRDRTFIYAHPDQLLATEEIQLLDSLLQRRAHREPLQYISGVQEFFGLEFEVTPDVLIPRPETEIVVEQAIGFLQSRASREFCDVGVGSGCISVSILHHVSGSSAVGTDISEAALRVANRNAERHQVTERLSLVESDVFGSLGDRQFDMIVSNPPYIPISDMGGLQAEVRDFEPHNALTDGADGLSIIRRIISDAPRFLHPQGALLMEIGVEQSVSVVKMFGAGRWRTPTLYPDLQAIPRLIFTELI